MGQVFQPPPEVSGESVLAAPFDITEADGVFQDSGLSVDIPEAGSYDLKYNVRYAVASSTPGYVLVRLYDETAGAEVANSRQMTFYPANIALPAGATSIQQNAPYATELVAGSARTIRLEAARFAGGTWTFSQLSSDDNGKTKLSYKQTAKG
jgi:hypothetical protein